MQSGQLKDNSGGRQLRSSKPGVTSNAAPKNPGSGGHQSHSGPYNAVKLNLNGHLMGTTNKPSTLAGHLGRSTKAMYAGTTPKK